MSGRPVRIGNGAGFWGDNLDAPILLARDGRLDVLTLEYLAELTLAILAHQRTKRPDLGYVTDFPELLGRVGTFLREQPELKVVTNAGGLNAPACARQCGRVLTEQGLGNEAVGVVEGDDLLPIVGRLVSDGLDLSHMETGQPIAEVLDRLVCANAYLGALPIVRALEGAARVVITGRVADASLTLGPAWQRFGWKPDDWSSLAGASVAGHLIECGAQVTGGLWYGWPTMPDPAGVGYPVAEVFPDGSCVISKPEGTGGTVNVQTVSEQLVYEIDDPSRYRTPDVDVDLTSVKPRADGPDRVHVSAAQGERPSDSLKVSAVYRDGWAASGMLAVAGRGAERKARAAGAVVLERVRRSGFELADSLVEVIGAGDLVPGVLRAAVEPLEVVLRVSVRDPRRVAVERFCRELAPLVTSGPSGIAGYATGRPQARPAFGYWPMLVPRSVVEDRVSVGVKSAAEWAGTEGKA